MNRSVIVSAVRTPFGKLGGGLAGFEATELGSLVIRNAIDRVGLENDEIEYVIMGQVLQGGAGQAPLRARRRSAPACRSRSPQTRSTRSARRRFAPWRSRTR